MRRFASLRRRADFARLRQRGRRLSSSTFTFYRGDPQPGDSLPVVGITVSKAIGKAVVRNKLRRRLAAIVNDALDGRPPMRLLVVPRPAAAGLDFAALRADVAAAFGKL